MRYEGRATDALSLRPNCDVCGKPALVDARTRQGSWGYLCRDDFQSHGVGLGVGSGQVLLVDDDENVHALALLRSQLPPAERARFDNDPANGSLIE